MELYMKITKNVIKVVSTLLISVIVFASTSSLALNANESITLKLAEDRYVNGSPVNRYAYNSRANNGTTDSNGKPIFQIYSEENNRIKTNYFCLNANVGASWSTNTIGTPATYTSSFNLNTDIEQLKKHENKVYSNIGNSKYLKQILWILDNMYVSYNVSENERKTQKEALLARAGIVYDNHDFYGNQVNDYRYIYRHKEGDKYNYSNIVSHDALDGYIYADANANIVQVDITDDLIESAEQAALWYFTNYLDNNETNSQVFNVKENGLELYWKNPETNAFEPMKSYKVTANGGVDVEVGKWKQEMATILCWYLIDAANDSQEPTTQTGNPLVINPANPNKAELVEQLVAGDEVSIVGPISISKKFEVAYTLDNKIYINDNANEHAYFSDKDGNKLSNQNVSNYVNKEFYISIHSDDIKTDEISISFKGNYKTNEKKLLISEVATEQPVVEITPKNTPFSLVVNTGKTKYFDLALRKAITKISDKNGNAKTIKNEDGKDADRQLNINTNTISSDGTATYNHRKDPIVIENGDTITYTISVYNEGDIAGYATSIVDKLPKGVVLKEYNKSKTTSGTVNGKIYHYTANNTDSSNISYSYNYNPTTNEITFTGDGTLNEYKGTDKTDKVTFDVECVVTETPSTSTNKYFTNIAYISEAKNKETNKVVEQDRDSSTKNKPSAKQETTGTKYNENNDAYHGGNNHNGDNNKDVYKDGTNNNDYFMGREDDDDFEIVVLKPAEFDLALQKYITSITSEDGKSNKKGRNEPKINTSKLYDRSASTAEYIQDKSFIQVKSGDYVTYTFTVYNEGDVDGKVETITDNIPTGLEFAYVTENDGKTLTFCDSKGNSTKREVNNEIYQLVTKNNAYWSLDSKEDETDPNKKKLKMDSFNGEETVSISCDVAKYLGGQNKVLTAYDREMDKNKDGSNLSKVSVTVVLRVSAKNGSGVSIRNEAAITKATDTEGNVQDVDPLKDRDSQTNQWPGKDGDKKYQDDEDFDNIVLGKVDLALTKFIAAVSQDTEITDGEYITADKNKGSKQNPYLRATKVNTKELRDNENCHDATYIMVKDPLTVPAQSYVLYNIRVYNEGEVDVYAGEVTDHLPEYLDFVECDFNKNIGWTVGSDGKTIKTSYLSYEKDKDNILKAFDKKNDNGEGSGLDYKELQVICRVNEKAPTNTNIVNIAEVTKYEDEEGDPLPDDIDSTPDNVDKQNEDDDDYEVVLIKTFDLSLLKYVTDVIVTEDGKTVATQTGNVGNDDTDIIPKVEVNRKKLDSTVVKFGFTIKITNEGEIAGYAKEITDYVPEGLKFYSEDNEGWTDEGNNVISTRLLENTFLQPGESAEVKVILRWINGTTNLGLKTNIAEISEDFNYEGVPDIDSVPDNKKAGEDDIDSAPVLLSIKTGLGLNIIMYASIGLVLLLVFGTGIKLIKKFVL